VPHNPQEDGVPVQDAPPDESSPPPEAKTESFLVKRLEPHFGQDVPSQWLERTRISESVPHFPQLNS
jgi:hypothetical protein